jgi:hypothetical protein
MGKAIDDWEGGRLRLFMPTPPLVDDTGRLVERFEYGRAHEHEYRPLGDGWAIRTDLPITIALDDVQGLDGIRVELDMRDGRLQCVGVASEEENGPALTTSVLRRLGPVTSDLVAYFQTVVVVRLVELEDGTVAAERPIHRPTTERPFSSPTEPSDEFLERYAKRPGRRPLSDEHLREIARLHREAALQGTPASPYIAETFPGYARATIRNWIRKARERGYLEVKGEDDG